MRAKASDFRCRSDVTSDSFWSCYPQEHQEDDKAKDVVSSTRRMSSTRGATRRMVKRIKQVAA